MMKKLVCKINSRISQVKRFDTWYFYSFIAINTLPVILYKFFPTVDGPAHLHNSFLYSEMVFSGNEFLRGFFTVNFICPNWLDHLMLGILLVFFPAFIAEKILILAYIIGFPVSFRFFFNSITSDNVYLVYFIFPFTYSFMFMYGFYNFHLALIFLFCFLALWNTFMLKDGVTVFEALILMILATLVGFSHLFVFAVLILVVFFMNLPLVKVFFKGDKIKKNSLVRTLLYQTLALLPGIILLFIYMLSTPLTDHPYNPANLNELFTSIKTIQPAKAMNYGKEDIFTKWIFISFVVIFLFFFVNQIRYYYQKARNKAFTAAINQMNKWLLISAVFLLCIVIFPENMSGGGFISSRFLILFFLFLIIGFTSVKLPIFLKVLIFVIINYVSIALLKIYIEKTREHSHVAEEVWAASDVIKENTTVFPLTFTDNWLYPSISNYLGVDKPIVVLKNYEASQNYFPLKWNWDKLPDLRIGGILGNNDCYAWPVGLSNLPRQIDYVFLFFDNEKEKTDTCFLKVNLVLENFYTREYSGDKGKVEIYKNNKISYLAGEWRMPDNRGYIERWHFDNDTLLTGAGYQIIGGSKQRTEKLAIVFENHGYYYQATVSGQNEGKTICFGPAVFSDSMVTFENKDHDFPNIIRYIFQNDSTLKVSVESLTDPSLNFSVSLFFYR